MAQQSTIEWTDTTWNPVIGCRKVSAGCKNCYAERMAKRLGAMATADREAGRNPGKKAAYLNILTPRGRWNGSVFLDESSVEVPLSWRTPRVIFVNSMSDLFHEDVPDDYIYRVAEVMDQADWHTYQVLTKRAERMAHLLQTGLRFAAERSHIWWGVSVENRQHGFPRLRYLQSTPARMRFLSVEPLLEGLGSIDLQGIHWVIQVVKVVQGLVQ